MPMKKRTNNNTGYKQSPMGLIPEDWEVKRLGGIATFFSGGTPKSSEKTFFEGDIPFIKSGEIFGVKTEQMISGRGLKESSAKLVKKGDILYALYGATSGQCSISKIDGAINQAILCIRPSCNTYYLISFLEYNKERYYQSYLQGGQGNLSAEIVKSYWIPLPPLLEQQKIAEILSTWDKAIELQTSIIDKLTLRKKGLMQQLLTGKKRLKGFTEPWNKIRLGAIGKTYNGLAGITKDDFEEGSDKYIPYINIYMNGVVNTSELGSVRINSRQNTVAYGDILFTTSSETPNEVGFSSVLLNEVDNLYLNSFCFGYRLINFNSLIPQYAAYYFRSNIFRKKMYKLAQGSTRFNISKEEVMKLMVELPPEQEQSAIADVLSTTDKTIQKEKQKLEALKQQKKGLMQQLLTGKRRV